MSLPIDEIKKMRAKELDDNKSSYAWTGDTKGHEFLFQNDLFDEFISRIEQNDESVPVSYNGYTYYTKYKEGEDYPIHYRQKNIENAKQEIILNLPEMAKGSSYFALGDKSVSENNHLMAFSVDLLSRRDYSIFIKDLRTGEILEDKIQNTTGRITWANDNKTLFYTKKDKVTLRSYQIYRHTIGTDQSEDVLVYEEKDETFSCFIYKTKSTHLCINFDTN